jgi:hypothetical protein
MPAERFNCYVCGEKIAANEESERVERGSLILWAHARCLKLQKASGRLPGAT